MDKRLNKFATTADYNSFIEGTYLKPNVSYIEETDTIKWQKDAPATPSSAPVDSGDNGEEAG